MLKIGFCINSLEMGGAEILSMKQKTTKFIF